jgi:hypothetical protein
LYSGYAQDFAGTINEFRIWNEELTAFITTVNMNAGPNPTIQVLQVDNRHKFKLSLAHPVLFIFSF